MNFANVDVIISEKNIDRYFDSGQIDMNYLKGLSYDALPGMQRLLTSEGYPSEPEKKQITGEILEHFEQKKSGLESQKSWQSFNISKYRAEKIIDKYID